MLVIVLQLIKRTQKKYILIKNEAISLIEICDKINYLKQGIVLLLI